MPQPSPYTIKILLAEDDPDDSMLFVQAVEELEIPSDVQVFDNGVKLVSQLPANRPDIIFLDMNMPLKNGLECLTCIRSTDELKDTPIIIYSTSHNTGEIKSCYEHGANCYVVKPFSFDAIVKMVKTFCNQEWISGGKRNFNEFVLSFE